MKRVAILGIDLQTDFTQPDGALYVRGAQDDIRRLQRFIHKNGKNINYIALTMDSHQPVHIATPVYWEDENGNPPAIYTVITAHDVLNKKWRPKYNKGLALDYLEKLEVQGDVCTIWPPHCILGSRGWCINDILIDSLYHWSIKNNKSYELFYKGMHQATEHYSVLKAAVGYEDAPETCLNRSLLDKLELYDEILVAGEAADYCVARSLNDLIDEAPLLIPRLVMLVDCMSWIQQDNPKAISIYEKAKIAGVKFSTSENYSFQ